MGKIINLNNNRSVTMDVIEAAKYIGVSTDTVYVMAKQKQIPHIKMRARILFRKEGLDQWMVQQEKNNYINNG